jgi:hypothetical protein
MIVDIDQCSLRDAQGKWGMTLPNIMGAVNQLNLNSCDPAVQCRIQAVVQMIDHDALPSSPNQSNTPHRKLLYLYPHYAVSRNIDIPLMKAPYAVRIFGHHFDVSGQQHDSPREQANSHPSDQHAGIAGVPINTLAGAGFFLKNVQLLTMPIAADNPNKKFLACQNIIPLAEINNSQCFYSVVIGRCGSQNNPDPRRYDSNNTVIITLHILLTPQDAAKLVNSQQQSFANSDQAQEVWRQRFHATNIQGIAQYLCNQWQYIPNAQNIINPFDELSRLLNVQ